MRTVMMMIDGVCADVSPSENTGGRVVGGGRRLRTKVGGEKPRGSRAYYLSQS
jgi:hypothetical protein